MHSFRYDALGSAFAGSQIVLEKSEANHLFKILRASAGDVCRLLDGRGHAGMARVGEGRTLTLESMETIPPLSGCRLHLYLAPPRRQKTDLILKQCTELGVARITPLICERSVSLPDTDSVSGRWNELLFEACKQSGNPYLPELSAPMKFLDGLKDAPERCDAVFYGSVSPVQKADDGKLYKDIAWFVGPEGGFTEEEELAMKEAAFLPLHMECWILRAETAAICGLAILRDRFV